MPVNYAYYSHATTLCSLNFAYDALQEPESTSRYVLKNITEYKPLYISINVKLIEEPVLEHISAKYWHLGIFLLLSWIKYDNIKNSRNFLFDIWYVILF